MRCDRHLARTCPCGSPIFFCVTQANFFSASRTAELDAATAANKQPRMQRDEVRHDPCGSSNHSYTGGTVVCALRLAPAKAVAQTQRVKPGPPRVPFQFTASFSDQPAYIQERLQTLRDKHVEWSTPFFFLNVDSREWPQTVSLPTNEWRKCKYFDT